MPIHGPLYIVTDDVVHPVGGDEEDPDCGLITRRYLQRLVLSQRVRYLRERLLSFLQAFIDSIHHTSVAEAAGMSQRAIVDLETNRREPHPSTLGKLAEALGVEPSRLFED